MPLHSKLPCLQFELYAFWRALSIYFMLRNPRFFSLKAVQISAKKIFDNAFARCYSNSIESGFHGNTAQFPPDGLSTAPAAAALRIMRYCPMFRSGFLGRWCSKRKSAYKSDNGVGLGQVPHRAAVAFFIAARGKSYVCNYWIQRRFLHRP